MNKEPYPLHTEPELVWQAEKLKELQDLPAEPTDQVKMRWFYWSKMVTMGKKGQYSGLPSEVVTRKTQSLPDDEQVVDWSAHTGAANKIARQRAKSKVAKASRKANR